MTIWSPRLAESPAPIYSRIADALERDVRAGLLVGGSQLPTHRHLARSLGITPVTVTRAYAEAARRGLVESTTGRGTFVREAKRETPVTGEIDLAANAIVVPLPPLASNVLDRAAEALRLSSYGTITGSERHRAAGAAFIGRRTDPARVIVTAGTQHALFLAFAAAAKPGDTVLTEEVTYHGAKAVASLLGVKLAPLPFDRFGILPDAFARASRAKNAPKVLYTVPSLHNPTGIVTPEKRRREIAAVAEQNGVTIIEDDVCGFLLEKTPLPLAAFAPDRTIFFTGLGKAMAPAMRIGYLTAPDALLARAQSALAATVLFASPLLAEVATSWIEDGTLARLAASKRQEIALRNRIARNVLTGVTGDPRSSHLWLELPRRWSADAFAEEARKRRVKVASGSAFAVDEVPH
nr:PLP-dependent aminotransferase family protein [Acidobacteriota bacterium]